MVQIGISFKAAGLVSFDCAKFYIMFNMNFTKDLVLCEIIERHKSKSIIVVVKCFYCWVIIQNYIFFMWLSWYVHEWVWKVYNYVAYSDDLYWALFCI